MKVEMQKLSSGFYSGKVIQHAAIWLVFIGYELSFIAVTTTRQASIIHLIIYYLLNIGLFYFNAHILLSYAFTRRNYRYLYAIALILTELCLYLGIKYLLDVVLTDLDSRPLFFKITELYLAYNLWRGFYFVGISIAYFSTVYLERFRDKNHQMETEQLKSKADNLEMENKYISAENAYLQNQISPHLLFNTLNFIYNTVYLKSEKAGQGVMLLADLMRYSLVSSEQQESVLLKEEVGQIENLISLSKLRFDEELFLRFSKKGKLKGVRVIPLLLVTLVENMVKHGDLWDKKLPALIRLEVNENQLVFETSNKKRSGLPFIKSGIGLKNLEKRLVNHYDGRYTLDITETDLTYHVKLTLKYDDDLLHN